MTPFSPLFFTPGRVELFGEQKRTLFLNDWELKDISIVLSDNIVEDSLDLGVTYMPLLIQDESRLQCTAFIKMSSIMHRVANLYSQLFRTEYREDLEFIREKFQWTVEVVQEFGVGVLDKYLKSSFASGCIGKPSLWTNGCLEEEGYSQREIEALRLKAIELCSEYVQNDQKQSQKTILSMDNRAQATLLAIQAEVNSKPRIMLKSNNFNEQGGYKTVSKEIALSGDPFAFCSIRHDRDTPIAREFIENEYKQACYLRQHKVPYCLQIHRVVRYVRAAVEHVPLAVVRGPVASLRDSTLTDPIGFNWGGAAEVFQEKNHLGDSVGYLAEFCDGGNLQQLIFQTECMFSTCSAAACAFYRGPLFDRVFFQVFEALAGMHALNLVHLDMKFANIFITGPLKEVRIGDFGSMACTQDKVGARGTLPYRDPFLTKSCIDSQTGSQCTISPRVEFDIWSAGVMLYVCKIGEFPWRCTQAIQKSRKGDTTELEKNALKVQQKLLLSSDPLDQLIARMLDLSPEKRPSARQIAAFFKNRISSRDHEHE